MSAAVARPAASGVKMLAGPPAYAAGDRRNRSVIWAKFRRNRLASVSALVVLLLVLLAVFAPWIAPHDPLYIDLSHKFAKPGEAGFWLGADELGRDVLSRLLHAGRVSLSVGLITALITVLVGSILGAMAGYYSGAVDAVIMRLVDVLLSMPTIFLLLALSAFLKPTVFAITLIIGLNSWMSVARMVRGQVLSIKQQEFILAAQAMGASDR
ncbi:MAG TPA: ABC transporter permease, partial [Candidatus Acidoferrum sp.]|nr:ABC transporter permease [Candidatus Acidoferrum sp.]